MSAPTYTLELDHAQQRPPLAEPSSATIPASLPEPKHHHTHAAFPVTGKVKHDDPNELSIYFVGTVSFVAFGFVTSSAESVHEWPASPGYDDL